MITVFPLLLGRYTYMRTLREETKVNGQVVELRTNLLEKDYEVQIEKYSLSVFCLLIFFKISLFLVAFNA